MALPSFKQIFGDYHVDIDVNGKPYSLTLYDTAGQEDFDRLRPLSYPNSDAFLMLFSVAQPTSLENITEKVCASKALKTKPTIYYTLYCCDLLIYV